MRHGAGSDAGRVAAAGPRHPPGPGTRPRRRRREGVSGMSGEAQVVGAASGLPGQAVYTPATLRIYDAMVLGFSNRFLLRCPTAELVGLYDRSEERRVGKAWLSQCSYRGSPYI